MTIKNLLEKELGPFLRGRIFREPPEDLSLHDQVASYAVLNKLSKAIEDRMKLLKPVLHEVAELRGTANAKGSFELQVGEDTVTRKCRQATEPDADRLRALLETKGIKVEECFSIVKVVQLDASKLKVLVDLGQIEQREVDALREVTYALEVTPGPELKQQVLSLLEEADEAESKTKRKRK